MDLSLRVLLPDSSDFSRTPTLLQLLRKFRHRKATDPRDKVYALLSLAKRPHHTATIHPDYSLGVSEVLRQATIEALVTSSDLSVLNVDPGRKFRGDLPSWVPDWDAPQQYGHGIGRADALRLYRVSSGLKFTDPLISKPKYLRMKAHRTGYVEDLTGVMWGDSADSVRNTIKVWLMWLKSQSRHIELDTASRAFWKILCSDVIYPSQGMEGGRPCRKEMPRDVAMFAFRALKAGLSMISYDTYRSSCEAAWKTFLSRSKSKDAVTLHEGLLKIRYQDTGAHGILPCRNCRPYPDYQDTGPHDILHCSNCRPYPETLTTDLLSWKKRALATMDYTILTSTTSRRLFKTSDDGIGLGLAETDTDDDVCIFEGGSTPFLVRKLSSGGYKLVGDCYVHGMMDNAVDASSGWVELDLE
jgi:hypothetical protein